MTPDVSFVPVEARRTALAVRVLRWTAWLLVGAYFVLALGIVAVRYLVLPRVDAYKDDLAALVSRAVGEKVTLGKVDASWRGLHPYVGLSDVQVHDRRGHVVLSIPEIEAAVGWRSLVFGELRFHWLLLQGPALKVQRDASGRVHIAGIEVRETDTKLADWLLAQGEIVIRDASIEWQDGKRGAPPLALQNVELRLVNRLLEHDIALRAVPPPAIASALDVRGKFKGRTLSQLKEWTGRVYAELDYADLAAWKQWIDYPFDLERGAGGLRFWLGLDHARLSEVVADVALEDVSARLAPQLPLLELDSLRGRVGARGAKEGRGFFAFLRERQPGLQVFGQDLAFGVRGAVALRPSDFRLRWEPRGEGEDGTGEFQARAIELAPFAALAERLPLPTEVRRVLTRAAPEGALTDVVCSWEGPADAPRHYSARGRFERLGMRPQDKLPGFGALAGSFELTEAGGAVALDSRNATIAWPSEFRDSVAERPFLFETLAARIGWTHANGGLEVKYDNVAFSAADAAGTAFGSWKSSGAPSGIIDLTLRGTRADPRRAYRFIPNLDAKTAQWLKTAIEGGTISDLRLRLKGELKQFPFDEPGSGIFELAIKLAGGMLNFAPDWPKIEGINADLKFDRRAMEIVARNGRTLGIPLGETRAVIADLFSPPHLLRVDGGAEGVTADFLKYFAASPMKGATGGATDGLAAEGRGKLALRLELPVDDPKSSKVSGTYQFLGDTLSFKADEPSLQQVTGVFAFSEQGITAKDISGQALGGPFTLSAATRPDGALGFNVEGTASAAQVATYVESPLADRFQGSAAYRLSGALRGKLADVVIESNLVGIAIDLPAPFRKGAQESWPSRLERSTGLVADPLSGSRRDSLSVTLGTVFNMQAQLRGEGGDLAIERAAVGLGDVVASLPREPGIFVTGNVASLDLDRLVPLLKGEGSAAWPAFRAISLMTAELTVLGRRFGDVGIRARVSGDGWQAAVTSRELTGDLAWQPEGRGSVVARLKTFTVPPVAPDPTQGARTAEELPALDVVAQSFMMNEHDLGRLELVAVNEREDWRIERMSLVAPEGAAHLQGSWRPRGAAPPRTALSFSVDVSDVGNYLDRIGYPHVVARGIATLNGKVEWEGPVYAIDYPSLTGNMTLGAESGQFIKVKPGIGKLLGVLSLQALPRRISLDFRDVFTEGFAFDTVNGTAMITKGVMSTSDLMMVGPSASVAMTGTASLAQETQDVRARVVPSVGDSVAAAAGLALVNPVVGLGALLAQRVLKDPIGQMLAFEYRITGPWEDPKVELVRGPQKEREAQN